MRRRRSLGRTVARTAVIAGTASAVSGHVARSQDMRYGQQAPAAAPQQVPTPPPVAAETDVATELRKFAQLRDEGILSEEEFSAAKAKLLGA